MSSVDEFQSRAFIRLQRQTIRCLSTQSMGDTGLEPVTPSV